MITYYQFTKAFAIVHKYIAQLETHFKEVTEPTYKGESKFANVNKDMNILDCDLSTRLINVLFRYYFKLKDMKIKELENLSMSKFVGCRGAGKVTLQELKELCSCAGVALQP